MAAIVQSGGTHTTASGPTSISPTFASTQVGTELFILCAVCGTTVSITTPTNWTLIQSTTVSNTLVLALFSFPNNPGAITAVAITIQAVTGGAAAIFWEASGMPASGATDVAQNSGFSGTNGLFSFPAIAATDELSIFGAAMVAPNWNGKLTQEWNTPTGGIPQTSTAGTSNVSLYGWSAINPGPSTPQVVGSLSSGVTARVVLARTPSLDSSSLVNTPIGGDNGLFVGSFNQGLVGG